jgi:hypothetical protein
MRELMLDPIAVKPERLVQHGAGHRPEPWP